MKTTVYLHDLRTQFHQMGRGEQFSYDGLRVLFEALSNTKTTTGSEVELDVIALCCEYSEDTPEEIAQNYGIDLEDDGNQLNNVLDYLHDHTMVCGVTKDGSIVYQQF
jgi:hypothetical protein